jgi:hypothetical protein
LEFAAVTFTEAGEKLQVVFAGRPEQASEIVPVKPEAGVNTSEAVAEPPAVRESVIGSGTMLKVGCGGFGVVTVSAGQIAPNAATSTEPSPVASS